LAGSTPSFADQTLSDHPRFGVCWYAGLSNSVSQGLTVALLRSSTRVKILPMPRRSGTLELEAALDQAHDRAHRSDGAPAASPDPSFKVAVEMPSNVKQEPWWKRPHALRFSRPTARYLAARRERIGQLHGLTPSFEEAAVPETTLFLKDTSWKLVHGHPPHQYFESFMCFAVSTHLALALCESVDPQPTLTRAQSGAAVTFCALSLLEAALKLLAYDVHGYLSSTADTCDLACALLQFMLLVVHGIASDAELPWSPGTFAFIERAGALVAFYRVPRLLRNWRFLRELLHPMRALCDTLLLALPAVANILAVSLLMLYIFAILAVFWFGELPPDSDDAPFWQAREERLGLNDRANFRTLPMALLTLFRIWTGDAWSLLLADCMRDGDGYVSMASSALAVSFFVGFVLVSFLVINLLLARPEGSNPSPCRIKSVTQTGAD
jgi:hypothetical protein